jgi:hypothetical protein
VFKKLLRLAVIFTLLGVAITAINWFVALPDKSMHEPGSVQTSAVKVVQTVDLNNTKWRSENPKVTATVQNGTIEVESVTEDAGFARWWYGTFDNPRDGKPGITSKGIDDPDKFYLSSAPTKDFVYDPQLEMLRFSISMMGITKVVEMKRV